MDTRNTWIVVADATRAKFYRQRRPGAALDQPLDHDFVGSHTKPSAVGDDRPGRVHERRGNVRHAMEPGTDRKRINLREFAVDLAAELTRAVDANELDHIVLVAPSRMLGELREALDSRVAERVIGEVCKDLSKLKDHELPAHLSHVLHFFG
jgi:protein required for attachment to host cells